MDTQYFFERPTTWFFRALRPRVGAEGVLESDGRAAGTFPLVSGLQPSSRALHSSAPSVDVATSKGARGTPPLSLLSSLIAALRHPRVTPSQQ